MIARGLRCAFARRAVVLLYHRIALPSSDPWSLCVSRRHFEEHLAVLRKSYHPLGLSEFLRLLRGRGVPHRAVVVTFDDGYADNLSQAKPVLEKYDVPATLFVVAGEGSVFWWDELQGLIVDSKFETDRICVSTRGRLHRLALGSAQFTAKHDDPGLGLGEDANSARLSAYREAWRLLLHLDPVERREVLAQIAENAKETPSCRGPRRLTQTEISLLHHGGLIEIGAHTMNHPFLPALSFSEQRAEIVASRQALEQLTGEPVSSFAYPFGAFSTHTSEIVRGAGYRCACTTVPTAVWRHSDPFRLSRVPVQDCDGSQFERHLADAFTRLEAH
jgi:peptidoglycan/xylan/chitin deacetylase (PgdA/CDA1 family)